MFILYAALGCGPNRFGANCQHKCQESDDGTGCKGMLFCLPDPYACTCATGVNGIICTQGMYVQCRILMLNAVSFLLRCHLFSH